MIGFTSTTYRQIKNLDRIIEIAKECGAECIEWGGDIHVKSVDTAQLVKEKCARAGIQISSYASYYKIGSQKPAEWENICKIASAMGAKFVRVWLGTKGSDKTSAELYGKLVADGKAISALAKEYGLTVAAECHRNTYNDTTATSLQFIADVGCDNYKTYYQSVYRDEAVDSEKLVALLPHTVAVHISFSEQHKEQRLRLKKDYNFAERLLDIVREKEYNGVVLLEYTKRHLPKNGIADLKKIRTILTK
ncbi:MAG: TIM barrel protein [Bacillota bacterium]